MPRVVPVAARLTAMAALALAVGVIFVPRLAPALHHSPHPTMTLNMEM